MNAFIFPGQGSQKAGMYNLLGDKAKEVDDVFAIAKEVTGRDVLSLCRDATEEELKHTFNTQLSVTAMNMAYLKLLENRGIKPFVVAGHSLGQLSALVAADVISMFDLFRLVEKRATLMSEVKETGKLATIIGLDKGVVERACAEVGKYGFSVKIALENATRQFVIGGKVADVDAVLPLIQSCNPMRIIEIKVSNAFHTNLMLPMIPAFSEFVNSLTFHEPKTKILLNAKGGYAECAEEIRQDIIMQCEKVVKWVDCMSLLLSKDLVNVAEVGVGRVLSQLMRGIDSNQRVYCLSVAADFDKFVSMQNTATTGVLG